MIGYEEAYAIAVAGKPNIVVCVEYANGWAFFPREDDRYDGGYGRAPVAVLRDGSLAAMPAFAARGTGAKIGSFALQK